METLIKEHLWLSISIIFLGGMMAAFFIIYLVYRSDVKLSDLPKSKLEILAIIPKNYHSDYYVLITVDGANKIQKGSESFFVVIEKEEFDSKFYGMKVGNVIDIRTIDS